MIGSLLFLGTGGSMGVPVIGCTCSVCQSTSPYNQRLRPSAILKWQEKYIAIDISVDFRLQALRYRVDRLDGIILTHAHQDHIGGLDDLRIFCVRQKSSIPTWMSEECWKEIRQRFAYFFESDSKIIALTQLEARFLKGKAGGVECLGLPVRFFSYEQMGMKVSGLRFGDTAYVTDIKTYSPYVYEELKDVKTLIISALRYTPSPFHLSVDEAIQFSRNVGAQTTWFTHISHELDHEKTNSSLPSNIKLAYDGLEIPIV